MKRSCMLISASVLVLLINSGCTVRPAQVKSQNTALHAQINQQIKGLSRQAETYLSAGKIKLAQTALDEALSLAQQASNQLQLSLIYAQLSDVFLRQKMLQPAQQYAQKALATARQTNSIEAQASSLNTLGNYQFTLQEYAQAENSYKDAINLLATDTGQSLRVTLFINLSYVYLVEKQLKQAETATLEAISLLHHMPVSQQKVYNLIASGNILTQLNNDATAHLGGLNKTAMDVFNAALVSSESLNFIAGLSYANGHLAELYLGTEQLKIAETLLSRALFFAAQNGSPELTARWQWQLARLRQQQGNFAQARTFFDQSLAQLDTIQPALLYGRRGWLNDGMAQQVYRDYISLLLAEAADTNVLNQRRQLLYKVRSLVENTNSNELTNYFQDECVEAQRIKNAAVSLNDRIQPGTAVVYTLIFPDHLVLLLNLSDGDIRQFSIPVSKDELIKVATLFRRELGAYGNPRKIRYQGLQLYNWLIQPIREVLRKSAIETLVIAPTGILRTIPFAALYDGQQFLVNDFALTLTPGLELTNSSVFLASSFEKRVLLNGLSESVAGFSPLPFVEQEVSRIEPIYESTLLMNEDFRYQSVANQLRRNTYSAIVFATHSQFNRDVKQSYLLSYDGKINLNELETLIKLNQFHEPPVDLLVLSACETAVGDEQAALGMAGVAVKAGAGSVVASLWLANDASTATLIPTFFENLKQQLSKAKALQRAQISMLKFGPYQHPFHWAGFLLIGNWL